MGKILKKVGVMLLALVLSMNMVVPAFAASTDVINQETKHEIQLDDPVQPDTLHLEWLYSTTKPSGVTYSTTATVTTGNTKLQQTLDSILVSILAGSLAAILPIPAQAPIVAGAIIGSLPTAFNGSTTLYYRVYTYQGSGAYQYFNKKCSVYYYYDKDMTQLASHAVYYAQKA